MKRSARFSIHFGLLLVLVAATLLFSTATGHAAGNTAKAALNDATETAKKWRPDAVLTSIYAPTVDAEGRGTVWVYGFYSRGSRSYLNVTAKGRSLDTLELGTGATGAVPADFLDSDQAMAAAAQAGLKSDTLRMRLSRTEWIVNGGDQKGALSMWFNPRTGKLIKRQTVE